MICSCWSDEAGRTSHGRMLELSTVHWILVRGFVKSDKRTWHRRKMTVASSITLLTGNALRSRNCSWQSIKMTDPGVNSGAGVRPCGQAMGSAGLIVTTCTQTISF